MEKDPKIYILEHSESKLRFYNEYLKRYLRILSLSPYIKKINIFDVFCGTGIYRNGKYGSPIIAYNAILKSIEHLNSIKRSSPIINLIVNDGLEGNIISVRNHLDNINSNKICNIEYHSEDSDLMFEKVYKTVSSSSIDTRNLIFIDPYGYKEIHRKQLGRLLENGHTEIILFLPVSHMYRFLGASQSDEESFDFRKLKNFINEFFEYSGIKIPQFGYTIHKFIDDIKIALNFKDKHYSASFYIKRNHANYNAVFFISSHIYGFENIINVKWELDSSEGKGSTFIKSDSLFKDVVHKQFKEPLLNFIKEGKPKTNNEIYLFTLRNEYQAKHATAILKELRNDNIIEVFDFVTNKLNKRGFYIDYQYYKLNDIKVYFKIK